MRMHLLFLVLVVAHPAISIANPDFWKQTGGPYGGTVTSFAIHPDGSILAGVLGGGVFRSSDQGTTWSATALTGIDVTALLVRDDGVIVAGTPRGIFAATNPGETWKLLFEPPVASTVQALAFGSRGEMFASISPLGVYCSSDSGKSWTQRNNGLITPIVEVLTTDLQGNVYAGTSVGLFRSSDDGRNWTHVGSGDFSVEWIRSVAVHEASGRLYAATTSNGVYYSTDTAATWSKAESGLEGTNACLALALDADGTIFVGRAAEPDGGGGVFKSADGGISWTMASAQLQSTAVGAISVSGDGIVLAGTLNAGIVSAGIRRSTDHGSTWTPADWGLSATTITSLFATEAGDVFAGTELHGIFRTSDGGLSWIRIDRLSLEPIDRPVRAVATTITRHVLAAVERRGILRSSDGGTSWDRVHEVAETFFGFVKTAANDLLACGSAGVAVSTDEGASWMAIASSGQGLRCLVRRAADGALFAGGTGGGVFRSFDDGQTWSGVTKPVEAAINALAVDRDGNLYAAAGDDQAAGGVFRSTDNGDSWQGVHAGIANLSVRAIVFDANGILYAATREGVFVSTDTKSAWSPRNSRLANVNVTSFAQSADGYLFAGTSGNGVARSTLALTSVHHTDGPTTPARHMLEQNYPNPFNPVTVFRFQIPRQTDGGQAVSGRVKLNVYDVLGREVAVLVDEFQVSGFKSVVWDASELPSGVYLYRLQAGPFSESKKLLLLR